MKPTTRFRFVIRYEQTQIRILQQWWGIEEDQTIGEWRDIPLEQERNFCSRCGKRTKDLTHIHTCTPPKEGT